MGEVLSGGAGSPLADVTVRRLGTRTSGRTPWVLDGFAPAGGVVSTLADMSHNGATGGYSAFLGLYPELGRGVVVLCSNASGADTERIAAALTGPGRR